MLEEKLLVTPEGGESVRPGHEPANQFVLTTALGGLIECEYLEHHCVDWNYRNLILKVVLVLVSPSVDIIRLNVKLEGPVRLSFLVSILIKLGDFHDRSGANVISHSRKVLSNGVSSALIVRFTKYGCPSILEKVERLLTVKREHGEPVG